MKLTLENGTEFEGNALLASDLYLYIYEETIIYVFNSLIDPQGTSTIKFTQANGEEVTFEGFTKIIAVRDEGNGLITAVMRKVE